MIPVKLFLEADITPPPNCSNRNGQYYLSDVDGIEICITGDYAPVYLTVLGTFNDKPFNITSEFTTFQYSEPNPAVFDVPSYCGCSHNGAGNSLLAGRPSRFHKRSSIEAAAARIPFF